MERSPALTPVGFDVVDAAWAEHLPDALLPARPGIGRQLEPTVRLNLLEALREELEHDGPGLLGSVGADANRDPAEDVVRGSAERGPDLVEEPLVVAVVPLVLRARELLRGAGAARRRDGAGRARSRGSGGRRGRSPGEPASPCRGASDLAGLRARVEADVDVAVERRDGERRPERRLADGQVDGRHDVVAVADEALVWGDPDEDVDVAGAAAERPGVALAREADALAVVDSRRDLARRGFAPRSPGRPRRTPGRASATTRPAPPHSGQVEVRTNWPKTELETDWSRPAPPHRSQVSGWVPGSAPEPEQVAHDTATGNGIVLRDPARGIRELDLDLGENVGAARRPRCPRPDAAEEVVSEERREEIGKPAEVGRDVAARAEALVAVAVVELPRLVLGENLVGLGGLAEAFLGVGRIGDVRVELAGERRKDFLISFSSAPRSRPRIS